MHSWGRWASVIGPGEEASGRQVCPVTRGDCTHEAVAGTGEEGFKANPIHREVPVGAHSSVSRKLETHPSSQWLLPSLPFEAFGSPTNTTSLSSPP